MGYNTRVDINKNVIIGFYSINNEKEVSPITLLKNFDKWTVGSIKCFDVNINVAKIELECINKVFELYNELKNDNCRSI